MPTALQAEGAPSLEAIFREHAPYVWRALRRLGVQERDVEDICQDVFLVVHRRLDSFHGGSAVRTWLYGICIRSASDYRKRQHRHRESPAGDDLPEVSAEPEMEEAVERRLACDRLDEALDVLDDAKRAVFVLYELEEMTLAEIASAVGAPLPTVYSRLQAARKNIQNAFAEGPSAGEKGSAA